MKYNVTVEIEVEASSEGEAWELVAMPFHNGSISIDQPHWKSPIINEPIPMAALDDIAESDLENHPLHIAEFEFH